VAYACRTYGKTKEHGGGLLAPSLKYGAGNLSAQLYSVQPMPGCVAVSVNVPYDKCLQINHIYVYRFRFLVYGSMPLIYQNESKDFCKLFLLKWVFLWLQILRVPQDFY